nr:hypothetical protein [Tanacetum cinerariifolium]
MGDEHLDTISEMESDKVIKSSVEDHVPIPSESEGILDNMCDVPFSDKNHFDVESDLIESLLTRDTLIVYSPKIDSLLEEFADINYVEASPSDSELVSLEETFSDHTKETSSGSTTTHADNSLSEYDSFLFEIEPDQGKFSNVAMEAILGEPRVYVSNDSLGSGLEVSFPSGTRNKIFNPEIFIEVQSERPLSREVIDGF